jgi:prolyl oligopeptidase
MGRRGTSTFTRRPREKLPDVIPRVQAPTAGGSAAGNADSSGLYYTRYPHRGERADEELNFYQQIYFHRLGTPLEQDSYELGREFPRIAETRLQSSPDGRYLLATVAHGDGGDFARISRSCPGNGTRSRASKIRSSKSSLAQPALH